VEALINLLCLAYPFIVHLVEVETLINLLCQGYARHSKLIRASTSTSFTQKLYN
jgi:hypothetical protein